MPKISLSQKGNMPGLRADNERVSAVVEMLRGLRSFHPQNRENDVSPNSHAEVPET